VVIAPHNESEFRANGGQYDTNVVVANHVAVDPSQVTAQEEREIDPTNIPTTNNRSWFLAVGFLCLPPRQPVWSIAWNIAWQLAWSISQLLGSIFEFGQKTT
jgi:hypothetical protein